MPPQSVTNRTRTEKPSTGVVDAYTVTDERMTQRFVATFSRAACDAALNAAAASFAYASTRV